MAAGESHNLSANWRPRTGGGTRQSPKAWASRGLVTSIRVQSEAWEPAASGRSAARPNNQAGGTPSAFPFPHLLFPWGPQQTEWCPPPRGGQSTLLCARIQMLISSGNTLRDTTPRNNADSGHPGASNSAGKIYHHKHCVNGSTLIFHPPAGMTLHPQVKNNSATGTLVGSLTDFCELSAIQI